MLRTAVFALLTVSSTALADEPACPGGDLLAGKVPSASNDITGDVHLLTDGNVGPEGMIWNADNVVVTLGSSDSFLTYDLGVPTTVRAYQIQADGNDTYQLAGSLDGQDFFPLAQVPNAIEEGFGVRTRAVTSDPKVVRYLRISDAQGDGYYSISEIQAFCAEPAPFPVVNHAVNAPIDEGKPSSEDEDQGLWTDQTSVHFEMILGLIGALFLAWDWRLRREGRPTFNKTMRDRVLMSLGGVAFLCYFNFGAFHFWNFVHAWDSYHYYVGSKYIKELSYDRLYQCTAVADYEDPNLRHRVERRKITDLDTNLLGSTKYIIAHPEECRSHFTDERWTEFKHDIQYFRNLNGSRWDSSQSDHGFNGTPVWAIVGSTLANVLGPMNDDIINVLTSIDCFLMLGCGLLITWAFGWEVAAVAFLVLATNFPSRWYWTGGSYLRWDWLFYMTLSVCLMKKEKPFWSGATLMYSTLLRIFPGFLFVGPLIVAGYQFYKTGKVTQTWKSMFAGAALAFAVLVPISVEVVGGTDAYSHFISNTEKHANTPLTNYMGLRTIVAYRPSEVGRILSSDKLEDPWSKWKEARLRAFKHALPIYVVLVGGFLTLLYQASLDVEPWMVLSLSAMMIAVGAELTSYYYAFLLVVALLWDRRKEVGPILLATTCISSFIGGPLFPWMPDNFDEQYTAISVFTLAAFAGTLYLFGKGRIYSLPDAAQVTRIDVPHVADAPVPLP